MNIGLMTKEEYLKFRNPKNEYHPTGAYDYSLKDMNQDFNISEKKKVRTLRRNNRIQNPKVFSVKNGESYFFKDDTKLIGIFHKNTLYYSYRAIKHDLQNILWHENNFNSSDSNFVYFRDLNVKREKKVKYLREYFHLVSNIAKQNQMEYPHKISEFERDGENYLILSREEPKLNRGVTIGIFNSEYQKVATAQDEWNTTLIVVSKEYRGKGFGKLIGKCWNKFNPGYLSGGFTPAGKKASLAVWEDKVKEMLDDGTYDELILTGEISEERFKEIIQGLSKKELKKEIKKLKIEKTFSGQRLAYVDDNGGSFILYDKNFLLDQDPMYILGTGVLEMNQNVGTYLYQLDYEREHQKETTLIGLQLASDFGETRLYDGDGDHYSDILELDNIQNISKDGDYIVLETNYFYPLKQLSTIEKITRKRVDPYSEILYSLQEQAYAKWRN